MIFKFTEFLNESKEVQIAVDNKDDIFINELIDRLSIIYKKRKRKYLRPVKIVGVCGNEINLRIHLSNGDTIEIKYDEKEGVLKIKINDIMVFYMDKIDMDDVIDKIYKYYKKHLESLNFIVVNKNNPF